MPKRKDRKAGEPGFIYFRTDPELADFLQERASKAEMSEHKWVEVIVRREMNGPSADMLARFEQVLSSMEMTQEQITTALAALRPSPGSAQGEEGGYTQGEEQWHGGGGAS